MITKIEQDKDGTRRIYHQAGTLVVDGHKRVDEKFIWTHPIEERASCDACVMGTIPREVAQS